MKQLSLPTYEELTKILPPLDGKPDPAEAHGLITGLLCQDSQNVVSTWSEIILEKKITKLPAPLKALYEVSRQQLQDFLFEFQLLLPEDDETLRNRAFALSMWCQGFLTGLKLVGLSLKNLPAGEFQEAIHDLFEIAKLNYDAVVSNEEDEQAFAELVEFVRAAVIGIYEELHKPDVTHSQYDSKIH